MLSTLSTIPLVAENSALTVTPNIRIPKIGVSSVRKMKVKTFMPRPRPRIEAVA